MLVGNVVIQSVVRGDSFDLRLYAGFEIQSSFVSGEKTVFPIVIQQNDERSEGSDLNLSAIAITAKNNQLIFRYICDSCDESIDVIALSALRDMCARRFRKAVNRGLCGYPLFGEEIDAVIGDDKGFAVEIGGLRMCGEIDSLLMRRIRRSCRFPLLLPTSPKYR